MQLVSGDQSGSIMELEGPLLSDSNVPFKVRERERRKGQFFFSLVDSGGGGSSLVQSTIS